MRKDQILDAYTRLRDMWVQRFGLHAMLVSNERDEEKLIENARILFTLAHEIYIHTGIQMEWINLWGGIW
jgi:diaminopimelate decarboxylase